MDAFHHQDVVLLKVHHVPFEERPSLLEIVPGDFHFSPGQERIQVLSQKLQVHGLQGLEVVVPVLILGRPFPLHKVIVQLDYLRIQAQHLALLRHPQGR